MFICFAFVVAVLCCVVCVFLGICRLVGGLVL